VYVYDMSLNYFRMRNVSDKRCRENQNTHFYVQYIFSENRALYEMMWKCVVEPRDHRRKYNTAHAFFMPDN
jgi:hypothetical protein